MKKSQRFWQSEVVANDALLNDDGNLTHIGFARQPYLAYSRAAIRAKKSRI